MDNNYIKFSLLSELTRNLATKGRIEGTGSVIRYPHIRKRHISLSKWFNRLSTQERLFLGTGLTGFAAANIQQLVKILWLSNKSVLKYYTHGRLINTIARLYKLSCLNVALIFIGYYWYRICFGSGHKRDRDILKDVNRNNEKHEGPLFSDMPEKIEKGGSVLHATMKVDGKNTRVTYELRGSCTVVISIPDKNVVCRVDCFDSKHFEKYSRLHTIDGDSVVTFYERERPKVYFYIHGDKYTNTSGVEFAKCGQKFEKFSEDQEYE